MSRPRIRTVKPECWQDERVGALSRDSRLLWIGLLTMADDQGRFRALPSAIVGHVFPYDQDAARKIERWLDEIAGAGMIELYEAAGVRYGAFPTWLRHQKINRPQPSQLPPPPGSDLGLSVLPGGSAAA